LTKCDFSIPENIKLLKDQVEIYSNLFSELKSNLSYCYELVPDAELHVLIQYLDTNMRNMQKMLDTEPFEKHLLPFEGSLEMLDMIENNTKRLIENHS